MNVNTKDLPSSTSLKQITTVRQLLESDGARAQLEAVKAKTFDPVRMMRVTANAIRNNQTLAKSEPISLLGALMTLSALGLEPNTPLGHAHLIPYRNNKKNIYEVQVIIGYQGFVELAYRSGLVTSVFAEVHYDDDLHWDYRLGLNNVLEHTPGDQDGELIHAYATASIAIPNSNHQAKNFAVLPKSQVLAARNVSSNWQAAVKFNRTAASPWVKHEAAMWRKTAIRRLSKLLPLGVEFATANQVDERPLNFSEYALNPEMGIPVGDVLEGDYIDESDAGEARNEATTSAQTQKPKQEPQSTDTPAHQAENAPETAQKPNSEGNEVRKSETAAQGQMDLDIQAEATSNLVSMVVGEIASVVDQGSIDAILDLYQSSIGPMKGTEAYTTIMDAAEAKREELA